MDGTPYRTQLGREEVVAFTSLAFINSIIDEFQSERTWKWIVCTWFRLVCHIRRRLWGECSGEHKWVWAHWRLGQRMQVVSCGSLSDRRIRMGWHMHLL